MANTLLTDSVITKEALLVLHQNLNFIGNINTQYDDQYAQSGAKIGSTLNIRQPNQFTVRDGATLAAQDVDEVSTPLQVTSQKGVDINFTSAELSLTIDEFSDRYIKPAMSTLASVVEADALTMILDVYNFDNGIGSAATVGTASRARKALTDGLAPTSDRCMIWNTQGTVDYVDAAKGLFQSSSAIAKQYKEGIIGRAAGFDHFENTLIPSFTSGTAAATTGYVVNGADKTGESIPVDGGSNTLLKGDVITFAGVFRVHPETKITTGILQKFVVTEASGSSATSLAISPALTIAGGRKNVTGAPADNAAVVKVSGGASAAFEQCISFQKDAFAFATADLIKPEGVHFCAREEMDGISMRIVRDYDITNDKMPCRLDILYGFKAIRPELASRSAIN
tara:strand:+ start:3097 stop:4284 length:1188 start_codon:yes stop_codon:yes gene_type:complete